MDREEEIDYKSLFKWPEYLVFALTLALSAGIGIFFGFFQKNKQKTTEEFLMGGRNLTTFPVAMSLIASFMSAITLLGNPVEIYQYGTQYWVLGISYFFVMALSIYVYLPPFFYLQVTSAYEYLEARFKAKHVRQVGSAIFTLQMTIYMALVVYAPALALSQVTGMNLYGSIIAIFAVGIFYTALGGMKAVMYTDTLQVVIMYGSMILIMIKGTIDVGGVSEILRVSSDGGRIEFFNFNMDPRDRHTVWGLIIGGTVMWTCIYGVNQSQVQRYLTVPTIQQARRAIWINFYALFLLLSICSWTGLVLYTKYAKCDPISNNQIDSSDQLLPLFVMELFGEIPGLAGLFVSGIFSGALSTVSSGLNSLAAITLEDFVRVWYPDITERTATRLTKVLSVVFGLISFSLVFVAQQLGGVLQAALSIFGMLVSSMFYFCMVFNLFTGVFTLGMLFPWANAKGALVGTLTALTFLLWLGMGANVQIGKKNLYIPKLGFSTEECPGGEVEPDLDTNDLQGGIMEFYRISYLWYSGIGVVIVTTVSMIVSTFTSKSLVENAKSVDPKLLSPAFHTITKFFLPNSLRKKLGIDYENRSSPSQPNLPEDSKSKKLEAGTENKAFEISPEDILDDKEKSQHI